MRRIDQLLEEYGASHKNATNKAIHWICVPLIFLSIVGLIWSIPNGLVEQVLGRGNPYANWATLLLVIVIAYYITLSVPLGIGMTLFSMLCLYIIQQIELANFAPVWMVSIIIFILAWIGQFIGHKVEGKKPSFFKDVQFLMVGPAWLLHFVYKKLGIPY
ncbi:DUF962 domain-containing protein [Fulvivirga sp. RKSG066]|uniref:Mpo1 family 2-hydroxy fatty acid dioxygenase n=1 Tax=Fulvivirga aurantia TaxID=2529383 RepID=UPI0012BBDC58|nr:Mpo1-like protein [Fulvivirga aurantia]MTI22272.1 DUF962 domain-containing protein [Fulvivirga aurantia]